MQQEYEKDIQKSIIEYLRLKRYCVFKHHSTGFRKDTQGQAVPFRHGDKGIADIIGCSPTGQFIAIEVKRKGGKPSPDQLEFIRRINESGGKAIVAFSIDEVIQAF